MNDHQTITAERGRRAEDLRNAAIAALDQQGIAAGMLLDLDDDTCVAAGPKAAILMLLNGAAPALQVIDAPRVEPGHTDSLPDRLFNLPCNWKGDPALHSAILMGHTMACEQAYNLVMADEHARAAVSAATKPTADLSKLKSYTILGTQVGLPRGAYEAVLLSDVQSLLATKPAAPAVPEVK
jgi:hypothetical protein